MKNRLFQYDINHICLLSALFLLAMLTIGTVSANNDPTSPPPQEAFLAPPTLEGGHYQIHCFDHRYPVVANTPQLLSGKEKDYQLQYTDQVFDLQQIAGFSGYFALDRWQKKYGDGGVDVTGAPNVVLAEGANATLVKLMDQKPITLEINVPAEGYVRFDWRKVGGSYFSLYIKAGDQVFQLDRGRNGYYISPLLQAGDQLQIMFSRATEEVEITEVLVNSFCFYTNAVQVITRDWRAMDKEEVLASFTQFISVEPLNLDRVVFPEDFRIGETAAIFQPESMIPTITGFPYLDVDGDQQTREDRMYLETSSCSFEVTWQDEPVLEEDNWTIYRHWQITDVIYQNIIEKTQVIRLYTEAEEEYAIEQMQENGASSIRTVLRTRPTIKYLEWDSPEN